MSGYCEQCGETICVCDAKVAELKAENESLREKLAEQQAQFIRHIHSNNCEIWTILSGKAELEAHKAASYEQGRLAGRAEMQKEVEELRAQLAEECSCSNALASALRDILPHVSDEGAGHNDALRATLKALKT